MLFHLLQGERRTLSILAFAAALLFVCIIL